MAFSPFPATIQFIRVT